MPKPLIPAWLLVMVVVASVALGSAAVWQTGFGGDRAAPHAAAGESSDSARRHQELRFLKAAFDRLEAEAKQNPNSPALTSLRTEQKAVIVQMREVARPLRPDRLPDDLRPFLSVSGDNTARTDKPVQDEPLPVSRPAASPIAAPAPNQAETAAAMPVELKPGLAATSAAPHLLLLRDPALSGVVLIARPRPPRPPPETTTAKPGEQQSANGDPKPPPTRAQVTVRAPEKTSPSGASGSGGEPVAILGR
jgi:hypothetical protein